MVDDLIRTISQAFGDDQDDEVRVVTKVHKEKLYKLPSGKVIRGKEVKASKRKNKSLTDMSDVLSTTNFKFDF